MISLSRRFLMICEFKLFNMILNPRALYRYTASGDRHCQDFRPAIGSQQRLTNLRNQNNKLVKTSRIQDDSCDFLEVHSHDRR